MMSRMLPGSFSKSIWVINNSVLPSLYAMSNSLLRNVWDNSAVLSRINKTTLTGNKNSMAFNGFDETSRATGSRFGGIRAYWKGEADLKTASKPKFRQVELNLNKLIGLAYTTDELLDDAPALANAISMGFRAEFDFQLVDSVLNGSGAGQPLGINNAGSVISVAKETGQAADTVVH